MYEFAIETYQHYILEKGECPLIEAGLSIDLRSSIRELQGQGSRPPPLVSVGMMCAMADLRNASGTSCRLFPDSSGKVKGKAKSGRGGGKVISGTRARH